MHRRYKDMPDVSPRHAMLCLARTTIATVFLTAVYPLYSVWAQSALPQGGGVVSGQARIGAPSGNTLSITQSSSKAIIDWNSFSVGQNASVNFVQPNSSSAILNRVTGSTSSTIAGQVTGNGQVFLVNPNGIAITPTGSVQVGGGFVGSTLNINNADFNTGNFNFIGNGASAGVSNAGSITSAPGGFVGLFGGTVSNTGIISVPLGKVGIGSGELVTINPTGDGFLQVAVPTNAVAANGQVLIDIAGRIGANGGRVEIKAATAQQAIRDAVNVSGVVSARSVSGSNGNIVLSGGEGGYVAVSGKLLAVGGKRAKGGSVTVTGKNIALTGAVVNVSGGIGGGTVQIGGGSRGGGLLQKASTTTVDQNSSIKADATVQGNGGNVVVWSNDMTTFGGYISARGGPQGGNGGQAEVSSKFTLSLTGDYTTKVLANLSALKGNAGTLLFDPGTVNILDQTSLANNSALNGPDTFTAQYISGQLSSANVTIDTNNATGANGAAGNVNLLSNAQISWSSPNSLTLNAAGNINFSPGASISGTGSGASLTLRPDTGGTGIGTVSFSGGTQVSLPSGSVNLYYNPASNVTVANGGTNNAAGTVNATTYTGTPAAETWTNFISAQTLTPWVLVNNVYDLQNINNNLTANYALGSNINAGAASGWNAGAGFAPLGSWINGFSGQFDGMGHVIDGLSINGNSYTGLFADVNSGSVIENVGLTNVSVAAGGGSFVGALVGYAATGSLISDSYSSGSVTGTNWVGGLVGLSGGAINASFSTSSVSGSNRVGGLTGETNGSITQSYASGTVSGVGSSTYVGGLAGVNNAGSISQSYATGNVSGQTYTGGLVGHNYASSVISQSYASGAVSASAAQSVGGLVGYNQGTVTQSYASGSVTGNSYTGGLVGWNDGTVSYSYATGAVTGSGANNYDMGGLVGLNNGTVTQSYASGAVAGDFDTGGLVGWNNGTIANSYFDQTTTGQSGGVGAEHGTSAVTSLTTSQAFTQSSYAGWDFANTWFMIDGQTRPFLTSEYSANIVNAHQLQLINMSNATLRGSYTLGANIDASQTNGSASPSGMWSTSGFVSIGTDGAGNDLNGSAGFTGSLNGAGHTIEQLTIVRSASAGPTYGVGFFGLVSDGGAISNLGLTNASITGNTNVGALAGINYGDTITNVFSSGVVIGSSTVGGLVGNNNNSGTVQNSHSSANVTGGQQLVGGLVGAQFGSATISGSYATGSVSGAGAVDVGGLVGGNHLGTITNSYAQGSVNGQTNVGGLIGDNGTNSSVSQSFATGATSANSSTPGGLAGNNSGSILQSYFDTQTTGRANGVGSGTAAGAGLSTIAFQNGNLPAGFSSSIWNASNGQYPQLIWPSSPATNQIINITATDPDSGNLIYGNAIPTFGYSVTNSMGAVLCTINCSVYFSGSPLIDTTLSSTSSAGSSAPSYIAKGNLVPQNGYSFKFINDTLTVVPEPITVTALGGTSTYGSSPSNPGLSATGLQNGQNASVLTGLSNSFGITNNSNAGNYTMDVTGSLTNTNYTVASTSSGLWTVNPASISVAALGGTSTYGSSPSNPGLSATGLQNGQNASVLTGLSNSFGITNNSNAGNYTMDVTGSLTNSNYILASTNSGLWTVNPASISVTALGGTSTYGSSPSNPGLSATGLQNGQNASVLTGLSNSFGITSASAPGTYATQVKGSLTNQNYSVANTTAGSWSVNMLRGSVTDNPSPSNPSFIPNDSQKNKSNVVLDGLDIIDVAVSRASTATAFSRTSSSLLANYDSIPASNATPSDVVPPPEVPRTDAYAYEPPPAQHPLQTGCAANNILGSSGGTNKGTVSTSGEPSGDQPQDCARIAKEPVTLTEFGLSNLNRQAFSEALDNALSSVSNSMSARRSMFAKAAAGTSIAVTAGIIGWLLRGGALLSALLSSMPMWRGFDPLMVVLRPKRNKKYDKPISKVELLFDDIRKFKNTSQVVQP